MWVGLEVPVFAGYGLQVDMTVSVAALLVDAAAGVVDCDDVV